MHKLFPLKHKFAHHSSLGMPGEWVLGQVHFGLSRVQDALQTLSPNRKTAAAISFHVFVFVDLAGSGFAARIPSLSVGSISNLFCAMALSVNASSKQKLGRGSGLFFVVEGLSSHSQAIGCHCGIGLV